MSRNLRNEKLCFMEFDREIQEMLSAGTPNPALRRQFTFGDDLTRWKELMRAILGWGALQPYQRHAGKRASQKFTASDLSTVEKE